MMRLWLLPLPVQQPWFEDGHKSIVLYTPCNRSPQQHPNFHRQLQPRWRNQNRQQARDRT